MSTNQLSKLKGKMEETKQKEVSEWGRFSYGIWEKEGKKRNILKLEEERQQKERREGKGRGGEKRGREGRGEKIKTRQEQRAGTTLHVPPRMGKERWWPGRDTRGDTPSLQHLHQGGLPIPAGT